jgi:hypothetical protein
MKKSMTWHPRGRNQGMKELQQWELLESIKTNNLDGNDDLTCVNDVEQLEMLLLMEELQHDAKGLASEKWNESGSCLVLGSPGTYSIESEHEIEDLCTLRKKKKANKEILRSKRSMTWSPEEFWKHHVGKCNERQVLRLSDGMRYDLAQSIATRVQLSLSSDKRKTISAIDRTYLQDIVEDQDSEGEEEELSSPAGGYCPDNATQVFELFRPNLFRKVSA